MKRRARYESIASIPHQEKCHNRSQSLNLRAWFDYTKIVYKHDVAGYPVTASENSQDPPYSTAVVRLSSLSPSPYPLQFSRTPSSISIPSPRYERTKRNYVYTLSVTLLTCTPHSAIFASSKNSSGIQTRCPLICSNFLSTSSPGMKGSCKCPCLMPLDLGRNFS